MRLKQSITALQHDVESLKRAPCVGAPLEVRSLPKELGCLRLQPKMDGKLHNTGTKLNSESLVKHHPGQWWSHYSSLLGRNGIGRLQHPGWQNSSSAGARRHCTFSPGTFVQLKNPDHCILQCHFMVPGMPVTMALKLDKVMAVKCQPAVKMTDQALACGVWSSFYGQPDSLP